MRITDTPKGFRTNAYRMPTERKAVRSMSNRELGEIAKNEVEAYAEARWSGLVYREQKRRAKARKRG